MNKRARHGSTWLIIGLAFVVALAESLAGYPQWALDTARAVVLVEALFVIVVALTIARRYYLNYLAQPGKARLLPRHVVRLGIGVAGLTLSAAAGAVDALGGPFVWWRTPLVLPTLTVLVVGLYDMVQWLPVRKADPIPIRPGQ